jgi:hypothetical protein
MKQIINIKTGYSAGQYGCSNEYFTIVWIDQNDNSHAMDYKGMYGSHYRVMEVLQDAGYTIEMNIEGTYGQVKGSDKKWGNTENEAIAYLKLWLSDNA